MDGTHDSIQATACSGYGYRERGLAGRTPSSSECLDNVVVLSERHLRRILKDYFVHYHRWRCHQSLEMDCPEPRAVQPPEVGEVVEVREAGGLYRHYERAAA